MRRRKRRGGEVDLVHGAHAAARSSACLNVLPHVEDRCRQRDWAWPRAWHTRSDMQEESAQRARASVCALGDAAALMHARHGTLGVCAQILVMGRLLTGEWGRRHDCRRCAHTHTERTFGIPRCSFVRMCMCTALSVSVQRLPPYGSVFRLGHEYGHAAMPMGMSQPSACGPGGVGNEWSTYPYTARVVERAPGRRAWSGPALRDPPSLREGHPTSILGGAAAMTACLTAHRSAHPSEIEPCEA